MFLVIGVLAGALTGVPIGPVNVAVIDAAYRHTVRRAIAVGLGGALADSAYAALGVLGVTPVLQNNPSVPRLLYLGSGIVLLGYGFITARRQPAKTVAQVDPAAGSSTEVRRESRKELLAGFYTGLALIVLNPAAIVTWVVIMGSMIPVAQPLEGVLCAVGVFAGSFGWFSLVAYLTHKGKHVLGDKAAWIPRVVGIALMGYALYLLAKAVKLFVA
jgi:threonine/homoserine/homoserine lactone efflux protein